MAPANQSTEIALLVPAAESLQLNAAHLKRGLKIVKNFMRSQLKQGDVLLSPG